MKNIIRTVLIGSFCLGTMLTGCANPYLNGMNNGVDSGMDRDYDRDYGYDSGRKSTTEYPVTDRLLEKGLASARKGNVREASDYFTTWYDYQSDKAEAVRQFKRIVRRNGDEATREAISMTLRKLGY